LGSRVAEPVIANLVIGIPYNAKKSEIDCRSLMSGRSFPPKAEEIQTFELWGEVILSSKRAIGALTVISVTIKLISKYCTICFVCYHR